jgi:hypothetical protein
MRTLFIATAILLLTLPVSAAAERSQDFGEFVVHFNAISTRFLAPEVANQYGIRRSPREGLLNIAVLRKIMGSGVEPVVSRVEGSATNLAGQRSALSMRELREGTAIYYIDTFRVNNEETLKFDLTVTPKDSDETYNVRFRQQFFVD